MLYDELETRQRHPSWSKPVDVRVTNRFESSVHRDLERRRREGNELRNTLLPLLLRQLVENAMMSVTGVRRKSGILIRQFSAALNSFRVRH